MFLLQLTEMLFPHPGHLIQLILEQQKKQAALGVPKPAEEGG